MKRMLRLFLIGMATLLTAFVTPPRKITLWLIGDSTLSVKAPEAYPETGWGMPFVGFFDSTVQVENRAMNGRSTKSFLAEGRWQPVLDGLKPGDYVFIQFGHNDESKDKKERYTTPEEFRNNLRKYVTETRQRGGVPVLITPVARRQFDTTGMVKDSHTVYGEAVRQIAIELGTTLIDLDKSSRQLLQTMGPDASKWLYNHLQPREHPNYPDGKADNTHFNELGARRMAELVLAAIREQNLPLAERIVKPPVKK